MDTNDLMVLRPSEMAVALDNALSKGRKLLLVAKPGAGKTSLVVQSSTERLGRDTLVYHPQVSEPTDFMGLPANVDGHAEFLPYGHFRKLLDADKPTTAFFDDLGQADESVQKAIMQILLAREINGQRISDEVTFVAASNDKGQKAGVRGILEPVKSRFDAIVRLGVHVDDWTQWASQQSHIPPELVAFINHRPDFLDGWEATGDIINGPSPRTIENAGKWLNDGLPPGIERALLEGAAGPAFAVEFAGFLDTVRHLPDMKDALKKPDAVKIPTGDAMHMYAFIGSLCGHATRDTAQGFFRILDRIAEGPEPEYAVIACRLMQNREPRMIETSHYSTFLEKHGSKFE